MSRIIGQLPGTAFTRIYRAELPEPDLWINEVYGRPRARTAKPTQQPRRRLAPSVRSDTFKRAERSRLQRRTSTARQNPGDVRPVAVVVKLNTTNEALTVHHSRTEVGVRIDSAIDDRDTYSAAVQNVAPRVRRIDGGSRIVAVNGRSSEMYGTLD
jgi:hypothetical protein